jgi:signal transduction histidine kinase
VLRGTGILACVCLCRRFAGTGWKPVPREDPANADRAGRPEALAVKKRLLALSMGLSLAVVLAAMGWLTVAVLRLDRQQGEAGVRAAFEENVRLALWRMETALAPLLARESSRPYFVYSAFYPAQRAYNQMFEEIEPGEILVASPLLSEPGSEVLLHFQIGPDGAVTSPQVPAVEQSRQVRTKGKSNTFTADLAVTARLAEFRTTVDPKELQARLPPIERPPAAQQITVAQVQSVDGQQGFSKKPLQQMETQQSAKNTFEWNARINQQAVFQNAQAVPQQKLVPGGLPPAGSPVVEGGMKPLWTGSAMLLERRIAVNGSEYVQGCWLDWPAIRQRLIGGVRDLFPNSDLVPTGQKPSTGNGRMLAALPLRFDPGPVLPTTTKRLTPLRLALAVVWACLLLTMAAVAIVLAGVISLSERRAAFTSAVTHELRTPLTTFRMYTEMLSEGMIPDESKRREYIASLHAEALRLSHLVENVLAYARLERGRTQAQVETIPLEMILKRTEERLRRRAEQAGLSLELPAGDELLAQPVRTDAAAVEQILFNLVDNAGKYAASAADRRLHIESDSKGSHAVLRVRDHGPGISAQDRRHLFKPFRKSSERAAHSAPGVGLGLALSRRLARTLGGDLRLDPTAKDGASIELTLPWA